MTKEYLSPKEIARLDPYNKRSKPAEADAKELLEETQASPPTTEIFTTSATIERAKEILGKNFLGVEAIMVMEQERQSIGVDVQLVTDPLPPLQYTERDLELAKELDEMLVLRTELMLKGGREIPLSLSDLLMVHSPFIADTNKWYKGEKFATQAGEIRLGWSLVKKYLLEDSTDVTWNDQEQLLKQYGASLKKRGAQNASVKRRTCTETVYDELLYEIYNKERLLPDGYDWTQTRTSRGRLVYVGRFAYGMNVYYDPPGYSRSDIGVCPSR